MSTENQQLIEYYFGKTLSDAEKETFKTRYETSEAFKKEVDEIAKIVVVLRGLSMREQRQREKQAEVMARSLAKQRAMETARRQAQVDRQEKTKQTKSIAELMGLPPQRIIERKIPSWIIPALIAVGVVAVLSLALTILLAISFSTHLRIG